MKREIYLFFNALMFYTRIPCPKWIKHDQEYIKECARYFSLIGWIIGGISALVFYLSNHLLSTEISLLLSMISSILITGAFHEDAFADVCDGFGGGWTKEKIILIMKDSRLGTFGVLGLICILSLKFLSLKEINPTLIPSVILVGHVLSRTITTRMLVRGKYVQHNLQVKVENVATGLSYTSFSVNLLIGLSSLFLLNNWIFVLVLLPMYVTEYLLFRYYKKWLNGYNGDCLGTVQQVSEVIFYLSFIILWNFI